MIFLGDVLKLTTKTVSRNKVDTLKVMNHEFEWLKIELSSLQSTFSFYSRRNNYTVRVIHQFCMIIQFLRYTGTGYELRIFVIFVDKFAHDDKDTSVV